MTNKPTPAPLPDHNAVSICARFDDVPAACRDAFDDIDAAGSFFSTWRWFRYLAESTLDHRHSLRLYSVKAGAQALLLPMVADLSRTWFRPRHLRALANFYTPLFEPVHVHRPADPQTRAAMSAALTAAFIRERRQWDAIDLHPLDVDDPAFAAMTTGFRAHKMAVQRYFCFGNWYLAVNGRPYSAVLAGLPSRLRHTLERKSRQLADRLNIDIVVTGGAPLETAINAYEAIYRSSWKQAEAFPDFMAGLMRLCAQQGTLRLGIAAIDGQPAAAQFWIVHQGVASIYKLAYDQRFAGFSVGSILTDRLMHHAIDIDGVREVDFLTGDDAYKADWMSHRRERRGLIIFNLRTLRGVILAGRHFGGPLARRLLKRVLNPFQRSVL